MPINEGIQRVKEQMELARRIEAMMRERKPEQASLFLARILAKLDDTSLGYLRIAFDFTEGLVTGEVSDSENSL